MSTRSCGGSGNSCGSGGGNSCGSDGGNSNSGNRDCVDDK